jgi:hypothetical protein
MSMAIANEETLERAARTLGRVGGRARWGNMTEQEKSDFGRMRAAKRWPSFAKELELEAEREASLKRNRGDQ